VTVTVTAPVTVTVTTPATVTVLIIMTIMRVSKARSKVLGLILKSFSRL
jgi:hypothetical protein